MASHHPQILHQHHCQSPSITATTNCCCSCHYNHCCIQPHSPSAPPQQQLSIDPLLQALGSLLQQQQQRQQQQPNLYPTFRYKFKAQKHHFQNLQFQAQNHHSQQLGDDQQTQSVISSLLQRINTLESSLPRFYTSSGSNRHCHPLYSLREAAARVIQIHFRAFLVRRSRTLGQLQDLAFIKSNFNSLKSSISNKTHFNCDVVSYKAMDFLFKLDSIQGGDPLIRDGKGSISREIMRFLEFIDGLAAKKHGCSYKPAKNVRFVMNNNKSGASNASVGYGDLSGYHKEIVERLSDRIEKIRGFSRVCDNDEEDVELEGFHQFINDEEDEYENPKFFPNGKNGGSKIRYGGLFGKPRVKKTVIFAENGNLYRTFSDDHESVLSGDGRFCEGSDSSGDHGETMDHSEIEERHGISKSTENDVVVLEENAASTQSSNSERNPTRNVRRSDDYEIRRFRQDKDGSSVFSAPMPVKMESRVDVMKNRML